MLSIFTHGRRLVARKCRVMKAYRGGDIPEKKQFVNVIAPEVAKPVRKRFEYIRIAR
jgi:hypothetical protein